METTGGPRATRGPAGETQHAPGGHGGLPRGREAGGGRDYGVMSKAMLVAAVMPMLGVARRV